MRQISRRLRALVATAAIACTAGLLPAPADAAGVAYLDGKEVWVASLDGRQKLRLSAGEGDWVAVAQSDDGYVVGVRLEAGKIPELSNFTIWRPDGTVKDFGPLAGLSNGGLSAYPLNLDITPGGGLLVYGFSNYVYGFPVGTLTTGIFLLPSATRSAPAGGPYKITTAKWPSLVGERIVAAVGADVAVQDAAGTGSTTFVPWIGTAGTGGELYQSDVAADGRTVASQLRFDPGTPGYKIAMISVAGLGGTVGAGDCWLPANGDARDPSLSADGGLVAWADADGVKIAGRPDFSGAEPCNLTSPARVIAPGGSVPSIGAIDVGAILAARNPAPGGGGGGGSTGGAGGTGGTGDSGGAGGAGGAPAATIAPTPSVKTSALTASSGAKVTVYSAEGGKATLTLTVLPKAIGKKGKKPVVLAKGSATLPAGSATTPRTIKLKATKLGKKHLKRLKKAKKKATLTLTVGGQTVTTKVRLR